jgi:hypothetical protein
MSTCHTVRFRIQRSQRQAARTAIDTYLSALEVEGQDARLYLMTQVPRPDGEAEYVQVILCDDESGCFCDDPSAATRTFRAAIATTLAGPPERHDFTVIGEGHPD